MVLDQSITPSPKAQKTQEPVKRTKRKRGRPKMATNSKGNGPRNATEYSNTKGSISSDDPHSDGLR